ncbi:hypothetical protein NDU88_002903 [Pleurodeles waltl]|uniref:Uncharacterized protein n=1 Tax=Pleurodeles waltl TaxID=8319 RepID=A0AAV7RDC6_PLEWA|nr:hypothetical protein NDU88_002903 [Pleurodeles waltl]
MVVLSECMVPSKTDVAAADGNIIFVTGAEVIVIVSNVVGTAKRDVPSARIVAVALAPSSGVDSTAILAVTCCVDVLLSGTSDVVIVTVVIPLSSFIVPPATVACSDDLLVAIIVVTSFVPSLVVVRSGLGVDGMLLVISGVIVPFGGLVSAAAIMGPSVATGEKVLVPPSAERISPTLEGFSAVVLNDLSLIMSGIDIVLVATSDDVLPAGLVNSSSLVIVVVPVVSSDDDVPSLVETSVVISEVRLRSKEVVEVVHLVSSGIFVSVVLLVSSCMVMIEEGVVTFGVVLVEGPVITVDVVVPEDVLFTSDTVAAAGFVVSRFNFR